MEPSTRFQNIFKKLLCSDCALFPIEPVTGLCGHTRCKACIEYNSLCACGCTVPVSLCMNVLVRRLIEKMEPRMVTLAPDYEASSKPTRCKGQRDPRHSQSYLLSRTHPYQNDSINLNKKMRQCRITSNSFQMAETVISRVGPAELECAICMEVLDEPITTVCGHTFCRKCIIRLLYHSQFCALCRQRLDVTIICVTSDTSFINTIISVVVPKSLSKNTSLKGEIVPALESTSVFPTVPYQMVVVGQYNRTMILQLLSLGVKKIGVVSTYKDGGCGTVMEIRDCLILENGYLLLSALAISRFTVTETFFGKQFILIKEMVDDAPMVEEKTLMYAAEEITRKANCWLSGLPRDKISKIEDRFGKMPIHTKEPLWWKNPSCPHWLWWLIAVLPFNETLQILLLRTRSLYKRMAGVSRALDILDSELYSEIVASNEILS